MSRNYLKAKEYYERAAKGNGKALWSLGLLYRSGKGVKQDKQNSRGYFEQSNSKRIFTYQIIILFRILD